MDLDIKSEICRRRGAAWAALGRIKEATRLLSDTKLRAQLFDSNVLPALCYSSETWATNKTVNETMMRTHRALERSLLGHNRRSQWQQGLRSTDLRQLSGIRDVNEYIRTSKHRWAGHVIRRQDDRWATRLTLWYPRGTKRTLGRPATRWSDAFKPLTTSSGHWASKALDRKLWKTCVQH